MIGIVCLADEFAFGVSDSFCEDVADVGLGEAGFLGGVGSVGVGSEDVSGLVEFVDGIVRSLRGLWC